MTKKIVLLALIVIAAPTLVSAQAPLPNSGFVPGNIWLENESFFAGETVRVYTVIRNNSGTDMAGDIVFYDNSEEFARNAFSIASGRVQDHWADWEAVAGRHTISAKILGDDVVPSTADVSLVLQLVDTDTDGDLQGDLDDDDDDNDGINDEDDPEPLVANTSSSNGSTNNSNGGGPDEKNANEGADEDQASRPDIITKTLEKLDVKFDNAIVGGAVTGLRKTYSASEALRADANDRIRSTLVRTRNSIYKDQSTSEEEERGTVWRVMTKVLFYVLYIPFFLSVYGPVFLLVLLLIIFFFLRLIYRKLVSGRPRRKRFNPSRLWGRNKDE